MRLGGWQRIGVVASVVWIVGAGGCQYLQDAKAAHSTAFVLGELCLHRAGGDKDAIRSCIDQEIQIRRILMDQSEWKLEVTFLAFVPLLIGWPVGYLALKWIRAGFQA